MNVIIGFSAPLPGPPLFLARMVTVLWKGFNEAEEQLILHAAYIIITGLVYNFCIFSVETYCEYSMPSLLCEGGWHFDKYWVKRDSCVFQEVYYKRFKYQDDECIPAVWMIWLSLQLSCNLLSTL